MKRLQKKRLVGMLLGHCLGLLLLAVGSISCDVDRQFLTGNEVSLRFELDTLSFDTVFTERGSATRFFKIYNNSPMAAKIDRITVAGSSGVRFQINVDGFQGPVVEDVTIWGGDSIYVFVEVEVDPTAPEETSPFIVEDRLVVRTGDREQSVVLQAFGQNANYVNGFGKGVPFVLSCNNQTAQWPAGLPYVIYGEMFIDSCMLEVLAGARIYIHGGVARNDLFGIFNDGFIYTLPNGSLRCLGSQEAPIVIQTDRLESAFQRQRGQYLGLVFGPLSRGNRLEHTQILHAIQGVTVDSLAELTLQSSQIAFTAASAISGRNATVRATNCLFYNTNGNTIQFLQGGQLTLDHCTVANYGTDAAAIALQNFQCYDSECALVVFEPMRLTVRNSILVGSRADEIAFIDGTSRREPALFQATIRNSVVRVNELLTAREGLWSDFFDAICTDCYNFRARDPLFLNISEDDYRLDTLSVAQDIGLPLPNQAIDLAGTMRDERPDAGCFERLE